MNLLKQSSSRSSSHENRNHPTFVDPSLHQNSHPEIESMNSVSKAIENLLPENSTIYSQKCQESNKSFQSCQEWTRPPEWNDEERMAVLFGNLYHNFEDKFRFWSTLIHSSSRELNTRCISLPLLQQRFTRNQIIPNALHRVIVFVSLFFL
jgi:hypothetical protein